MKINLVEKLNTKSRIDILTEISHDLLNLGNEIRGDYKEGALVLFSASDMLELLVRKEQKEEKEKQDKENLKKIIKRPNDVEYTIG